MYHYFAYGRNMGLSIMRTHVGAFSPPFRGKLINYRLCFNKLSHLDPRFGVANVEPNPGTVVEGVVYRLRAEQIFELDSVEGYPYHYDRILLQASSNRGDIRVLAYVAQPHMIRKSLLPSKAYLEHLLMGKNFLSHDYFSMLEHWPTGLKSGGTTSARV
ncbi:MAG: gamma-glutamylcyclotransferase [Magnetococcales bacterium]|nr:gamma-glutamylcyclotransferase [Magnetococcales bacterium]